MGARDLGERGNAGVLFGNGTMDFLAGWLLGYAQQGGLSTGSLLDTFARVRDGDPGSWTDAFEQAARSAVGRAEGAEAADRRAESALEWLGAAVAWRGALSLADPTTDRARAATDAMSTAFRAFLVAADAPLEPWTIDLGLSHLPAYGTPGLERAERLAVVVGGGDTHVEDLWFFGGRALLEAGWPVVLVDLPGQGSTPYQGLHFGQQTLDGMRRVFAAVRERGFAGEVALVGWSGGGFFTTTYASIAEPRDRLRAVVASAPMHDIGEAMRRAFPGVLRREPTSPVVRGALALASRNRVLRVSLAKYRWQFGAEITSVLDRFSELGRVDLDALDVPVLGLVGLAEAEESRRQARDVIAAVAPRHPVSRLVTFDRAGGGSAHCQVGNLPLAMAVAVQWLDEVFASSSASVSEFRPSRSATW